MAAFIFMHIENYGIKSSTMRWAGQVARIGNMSNADILVDKRERKRPLSKPSHRELSLKCIFI
jgi:hypothetical protein